MIGGKKQLLRVLNSGLHSIKVPKGELEGYLDDTSYFDYLKNVLGVDDPGVLRMAQEFRPRLGQHGSRLDEHPGRQGLRSNGILASVSLR